MPNIMTKRGSLDNVVTYEHICDTTADMANIPKNQITLGTVCIVIKGESGGLEVYMANTAKEWESITELSGSNNTTYTIYPCNSTEYDEETGLPTIEEPDESTIYLVPDTNENNNLFTEYFYVNGEWERFGGAALDLSPYVEKITGKGLSTNDFTDAYKNKVDAALTQHQDISGKADKTDTVLDTTLSLGRRANTIIGNNSVALGFDVTASAPLSHAEGYQTTASKNSSHAEGIQTTASGTASHTEGQQTTASGYTAHAEGNLTIASGEFSHAEGQYTIASGIQEHVSGIYNIKEANEWISGATYKINDLVLKNNILYKCIIANSDASWKITNWQTATRFLEAVGNGTTNNARSNVRSLDFDGNEYLKGDLYVNCNADTTGGKKVATATDTVLNTTLSLGRKANTTVGSNSVALGANVAASGAVSHAEGYQTTASGVYSHSEGYGGTYTLNETTYTSEALGTADHTEGYQTRTANTSPPGNHAEGFQTAAIGGASHAEGFGTIASGIMSHAEGYQTTASGVYAHAEGNVTSASGTSSHAEGLGGTYTLNGNTYTSAALGTADHIEGYMNRTSTTASYGGKHAEGYQTAALGDVSHAEGYQTTASGNYSHAEGHTTSASGTYSHSEGYGGTYTLNGTNYTSAALGTADHIEGYMNRTANNSPGNHAEGYMTAAIGGSSHSEGLITIASGYTAHAEGEHTTASGAFSHAEGEYTTAGGVFSHAEGQYTTASADCSHAEGYQTLSTGYGAHAEANLTIASGANSHAEGCYTVATGDSEHVSGKYNVVDIAPFWTPSTSYNIGDIVSREETFTINGTARISIKIFKCKTANSDETFKSVNWTPTTQHLVVVGNGTANNARSNAYSLDAEGTGYYKGDLYVNCNADSTGGEKVATETYVNSHISLPTPPTADGIYTLQATIENGSVTYSWVILGNSQNANG